MTRLEVLQANQKSLAELTREANENHQQVLQSLENALERAISTGKTLSEIKDTLSHTHGAWTRWCNEDWQASKTAAFRYVRLYHYRDQIIQDLQNPSLTTATTYIVGLPALGEKAQRAEARKTEAMRLRRQGIPHSDIAEMLGVSPSTIDRWTNPKAYKRRTDRLLQRRRASIRALRNEQASKAAKAKGGQIAVAYSLASKLRQALDQAIEEETNPQSKLALEAALRTSFQVWDHLVIGIGTSQRQEVA